MAEYNLGRAKGEIVIDSSKAEKGFDRARDSQDKFAESSRKAGKDHEKNKKETLKLVNATILFTGLFKAIKFPAIIAGISVAAQALSALTAGAVAFVGAIGPSVGILAALPGLILAAGQAMGVIKLATIGLGDEIKKLSKEAGEPFVAPQVKEFAKFIFSLRPELHKLQSAASAGLLPGVEAGIRKLIPLMPMVTGEIGFMAQMFGRLATSAGQMIGGWGKDLQLLLRSSTGVMGNFGVGMLSTVSAMKDMMVVAIPLTEWVGSLAKEFGKYLATTSAANRANGDMAAFFERTKNVLSVLGNILRNVGVALRNTFGAGVDLGNDMLVSLEKLTRQWAEWTGSVAGKNVLKDWFENARGPLEAMGRLISNISTTFKDLGEKLDLENIIDKINNQIVPALANLAETAGQVFTTALIDLAGSLVNIFAAMATETGPLTIFVQTLGFMAAALVKLYETSPQLLALINALLLLKGLFFAFKVAGFVTGITALKVVLGGLIALVKGGGLAAGAGLLTKTFAALGIAMNAVRFIAVTMAAAMGLPIAAFVAIGVAVAALAYLIFRNWDTIKEKTTQAFNFVKDHIGTIMRVVLAIMTGGLSEVVRFVINNWDNISRRTSEIWNGIRNFFSSVLNNIKGIFFNVVNGIREFFVNKFNEMRDRVTNSLNSLRDRVGSITSGIKKFFSDIWTGIWQGAKAAVDRIIGFFTRMKDRIVQIASGIKKSIQNLPFMSGSPIPMVVDAKAMAKGVNAAFRKLRTEIPGAESFRNFQSATALGRRPATFAGTVGAPATGGSSNSVTNNFNANVNGGNVDVNEDRLMELFGRMELLYG